jgi:hypothetical protein
MEKLLQVLSQIEGRLAQIEQNTSARGAQPLLAFESSPHQKPNNVDVESLPEHATSSREPDLQTRNSQPLPNEGENTVRLRPVDEDGIVSIQAHDEASSLEEDREVERMKGNWAYFNAEPYEFQNFSAECHIKKVYHGKEAEALWTSRVGQWWSLPPDNRIDLSFQRHILETTTQKEARLRLDGIDAWFQNIGGTSGFTVQDYDRNGQSLEYQQRNHYEQPVWTILGDPRRYMSNFEFASKMHEPKASHSTRSNIGMLREPSAWRRLM